MDFYVTYITATQKDAKNYLNMNYSKSSTSSLSLSINKFEPLTPTLEIGNMATFNH